MAFANTPVIGIIWIMVMALMSMETQSALPSASSGNKNSGSEGQGPEAIPLKLRFYKFTCGKPQQKAFFLPEHLKGRIEGVNMPRIVPHDLVIDRCDGQTGCCQNENDICSPRNNTTVMENLIVDFIYPEKINGRSRREEVTLSVEKHTECECLSGGRTTRQEMELMKPKISIVKRK